MPSSRDSAHEAKSCPAIETVSTDRAPRGRGPFPQAVIFGDLVFVSGQGPLDPLRNEPDTGTFAHEVHTTIRNLASIAEAAGCALTDAVKLTVYLTDVANVPAFNEIYREYFHEPLPARTLVEVGLRGIQVEIDGVFARRGAPLEGAGHGAGRAARGEAAS